MTTEERFWSKVHKTEGCWLWRGSIANRYGRFSVTVAPRLEKLVPAHRFAYEMAYGHVSIGMVVMHKCDNPTCVRPAHLQVGTQAENLADMAAKNRGRRPEAAYGRAPATRCKRGHEFTPENTIVRKTGGRLCAECARAYANATYRRLRDAALADPESHAAKRLAEKFARQRDWKRNRRAQLRTHLSPVPQ